MPLTEAQLRHPASIPVPERIDLGARVLRAWRPADAPALFEAVAASAERLAPWIPWAHLHPRVEATGEFVASCVGAFAARTNLVWGLFAPDGAVLGGAGLHRDGGGAGIDWGLRAFEVGYWLRTGAEGRGHAGEAVAALLGLAFRDLDAERVALRCDPRNTRSVRVAERAGFVLEGTARRSVRWRDGEVRDLTTYALVRGDAAVARALA